MDEVSTYADLTGTILSYTTIAVPAPAFADVAPYTLAIIETADGERLLARLDEASPAGLRVGAAVVYVTHDEHGPLFQLREH